MVEGNSADATTESPFWAELARPAPPIATLSGDIRAEACVVGLGGSGLAAVTELLRRGLDVVGVDARGVAAGAAGRNGGFLLAGLAPFHHDAVARFGRARAAECYRRTQAVLDEMADETPEAVRRLGSLRIAVGPGEIEDCRRQLDAMAADGLAVEEYSGPEGDGLLFPGDASLQPELRCRILAERVQAGGARLFGGAEVVGLAPTEVVARSGRVIAKHVLVCVDGGLERLVLSLAGSVRSARLQMLSSAPLVGDHGVHRVTGRLVYRRYGYDYYQQAESGEIVLGGGRDQAGESEWTAEASTSPAVQSYLDGLLAEVVAPSGLPAPPVRHRWSGVVAYHGSGLPVVRRVAEGVYVAGAYSGTGNVIGRIAGRALVELALDGRSAAAELFDGG